MDSEPIADHRDLVVWQKAMHLAADIFRATGAFPRAEMFGLTAQLRKAAISIPSNVAEGSARRTSADFLAFLHIARGSQAEVDTQLRLAMALGYVTARSAEELLARTEEVGRLLTALIHGIRRRAAR